MPAKQEHADISIQLKTQPCLDAASRIADCTFKKNGKYKRFIKVHPKRALKNKNPSTQPKELFIKV